MKRTKGKVPSSLLPPSARSREMEQAIQRWQDMICGKGWWLSRKRPRSLQLAALSCQYLSRFVTAELEVSVTGKEAAVSDKAALLQDCLQNDVFPNLSQAVQTVAAGGQAIWKPYVSGGRLKVECLRADQFYPVADAKGGMVFLSYCEQNGKQYLRSEYHRMQPQGYQISNRAYLCDFSGRPQREVALATVKEWEELEAEIGIQGLEQPLWARWSLPFTNCIDGSGEAVAMFAAGETCLADLDRLYNDYCYEFESARRKLILREDALRMDNNGRPILPQSEGADDVYLPLDLPGDSSMAFGDYTPEIRENSYRQAINQLLRLYELQCGLSSGSFSLDEKGALTATEVISQDRRSYYTVCEVQRQGKAALEQLVQALSALCDLYDLAEGDYELSVCFGDSIFEDTATEFERRWKLVELGMKPELLLAWYFGKNEEVARAMLQNQEEKEENCEKRTANS